MSKKCTQYKTVSREDGSTYERCAKMADDGDTVMVPTSNSDMGRRSRKRRSRKFGLVVPEPLRGVLGIRKLTAPALAVGGGGSILGMFLARRYGGNIHPAVPANWPISGALFGAALSVPLYWVKGRDAMIGGVATAAVTGATGLILNKVAGFDPFAGSFGMARRRSLGLLSSQQIAGSPRVADTTAVPHSVQMQTDSAAWGAAF